MPNIMITNKCNLRCEYCFANEYVNKFGEGDISEENFMYFLSWINGSNTNQRVGLIGGEPTIHNNFDRLMELAKATLASNEIVIFTNGTRILDLRKHLIDPRIHTLINVNSREIMGTMAFDKVEKDLVQIIDEGFRSKINIGINIYKQDQDFSDFMEIVKIVGVKRIRVGITVPNDEVKRSQEAVEYFRQMTKSFFELCTELKQYDAYPSFDCNGLPSCSMKPEELFIFRSLMTEGAKNNRDQTLLENIVPRRCSPVIDVKQDLTAIRCFGMSSDLRVSIMDYQRPEDLESFFTTNTDKIAATIPTSKECVSCQLHRDDKCMGGCLSYKIKDIQEARAAIMKISDRRFNKGD